jgi:hypothetical protein
MKRYSFLLKLVALTVFLMAVTSVANAQATRTWVSGVGDDVNPCSRTAPCKTFAGAISKTAKDGEINCLDPAGYGAVTITKSITIDCEDTQGSILAAGTNGVIINITSGTDVRKSVRLRGISINGASTGFDGVRVLSALNVVLEEMVIDGFTGDGVEVATPNTQVSRLQVWHSAIRNNAGHGIVVATAAAGGTAFANIDGSHFAKNSDGVRVGLTGKVSIRDCAFSQNNIGVHTVNGDSEAAVHDSSLVAGTNGVRSDGGTARVSFCQIQGNTAAFVQSGAGVLKTFGNNFIDGNGANAGVITPIGPS